jgi:SAM-dependent methyltransferase/lauroyl/myristoyl acyltransferase
MSLATDGGWAYRRLVRLINAADYRLLLPLAARLPLAAGYAVSAWRGRLNGLAGRDWRSVALGSRYVARQSAAGFRMLYPQADDATVRAWVRMRFETESREEFEGRLMAAGRVGELRWSVGPEDFLRACLRRERGLLLLTPHFDSFTLGIAFLGQAGVKVNAMSSAITNHPQVTPSVRAQFFRKYRGMERYMNGGQILDQEDGLRPFYRMLERKECLVILADAPAVGGGVTVAPHFLGARRRLAGGGVGMARRTGSDIGAFVCRYAGPGRYTLEGTASGEANDPRALESAYGFLSEAISSSPGRWWGADLLAAMTPVEDPPQRAPRVKHHDERRDIVASSAMREKEAMESTLMFTLDSPKYHLLKKDASNRFSGWVFDCDSKPIKGINVYRDHQLAGSFPADLASEDIHRYIPHVPATRNCRFEFDLYIDSRAALYSLEIVYADQSIGEVIPYSVSEVTARQNWFDALNARLKDIPTPSGDLVYATQGIRDELAYRNSIIPGIDNMRTYLAKSGVELNRVNSILDIGCGTGRLLVGWYLDNPDRRLFGCDINKTLIDWDVTNLPGSMHFHPNALLPPLPYEDEQFDFVYLVSVFTHLSLETQKLWVNEIARILAPDGILLITFHGDINVRLSQSSRLHEFERQGYLETVHRDQAEGANSYAAYHSRGFVTGLFHAFDLIGYFPRGNAESRVLFPVAAFQDIYVFRKAAQRQ